MKRTPKTPALAKLAMLLLFAIATVAILDTTSISAQELGRTITSPFGIARQTSASESGSDGDTFVDPETGEVGHIIRNPFGVANPEGVDTGIDIPDSGEEEVGGIITSPFGVPASDDIDTGVDVFEEDEEYLISLPDDEETDAEESDDVDEVDDETSDDVKELEKELAEATTEKYVPVKDNPIPGRECDTIDFSIVGICGSDSVTSSTELPDQIPTLRVPSGESFTIQAVISNGSFSSGNPTWTISSGPISPCLLPGATSLSTQNIPAGNISATFQTTGILWAKYSFSATAIADESSCTRILNVEIYSIDLRIDSDNNGVINDLDEACETNNPGKIIGINNLDTNKNWIPDFADGFDCTDGGTTGTGKSASFTEMKLIIPSNLSISSDSNYSVKFSFTESPYTVTRTPTGMTDPQYFYSPPTTGQLRIWTKDGGEARLKATVKDSTPGHHVPNNDPIPLNKLFSGIDPVGNTRTVTLYVEAVNPSTSAGGNAITATLCQNSTEMVSDSVKTTAVKVSAVTPNKGRDDKKAIKIMIKTNPAMDALSGEDYRYYTPAQTEDRKVNITAIVTPKIEGVPVYFEVIDPDDLSPYEGKEYDTNGVLTNDEENLSANDNLDDIKTMKAPSNYATFQNACLREVGVEDRFTRYATTNDSGEATIRLDITNKCSGDNYIVRASCVNPDIAPNELRPFDKYSTEPPPTLPSTPPNGVESLSEEDINGILNSLQYEDETTIAQTALLVAWKRTYIEHANMYKKGATVTVKAPRNSSSLTVDNPSDFSGESSPGEGDGSEITIFLPPDGATSYDRRVVSISGNAITLNTPLPVLIPQYSGVKLLGNDEYYMNNISYLTKAFGGDAGGADGGAFIEFKEIGIHFIPKYTVFSFSPSFSGESYSDKDRLNSACVNAFNYGLAWFIHHSQVLKNTMSLVACTRLHDPDIWGVSLAQQKQSLIFEQAHPELITMDRESWIRHAVAHEIGHIWQVDDNPEAFHIDRKAKHPNHEGSEYCLMSEDSNGSNSTEEFCIECLLWLRQHKCFYTPPPSSTNLNPPAQN